MTRNTKIPKTEVQKVAHSSTTDTALKVFFMSTLNATKLSSDQCSSVVLGPNTPVVFIATGVK